jgi:aspartate kinase
MSLVVQKFGGTSVADAERMRRVAARVASTRREGHDVVVVVSAMGKTTDDLIALAAELSSDPPAREMDMLLTAGERISMALLAMALHEDGIPAVSFTGSQAGILTDTSHGAAKILDITGGRVTEALGEGRVVSVGRGGSDASAVALAAALGADACEIYTDVDGVFTADPRLVPDARKLEEVSFEEMLELAAHGSRVLMARSVEFGRRFGIPLHVRSSFHDRPGTWVKETAMEQAIISGVAHDTSEAKVTVSGVPDEPGVAATLFERLADAGINIDMIVQNVSSDGRTDISFTAPEEAADLARKLALQAAADLGAGDVDVDTSIAKVSLVGAGMKSEPGVAARLFRSLADAGINIEMISTSTIRVSVIVDEADTERAVRTLAEEFGLTEEVAP